MSYPAGPPEGGDSLALAPSRVYAYYLDSLRDEHSSRIFARDWPGINRTLGEALRRVGGAAWWADRESAAPADDTPYVLASLDEATGTVRLVPATHAEILPHPHASLYLWDGSNRRVER
jgi:hypothetical protein